jgi:hypothetical protein
VNAEIAGAAGPRASIVRHDPSGEIGRSLRRLISQGEALLGRLDPLDYEVGSGEVAGALGEWRIACVLSVREGFEREAVDELCRSISGTLGGINGEVRPSVRQRVRNTIALLAALEGTLHRQRTAEKQSLRAAGGGRM